MPSTPSPWSPRCIPLPERISFPQGAGVFVPYATAYRALTHFAHAGAGETVLVHGASGGVGLAGVQVARALGMTVIGTAGTEKGRDLAGREGAHHVLDHGAAGYRGGDPPPHRRPRRERHPRDAGKREPWHRPEAPCAARKGGRDRQPRRGDHQSPRHDGQGNRDLRHDALEPPGRGGPRHRTRLFGRGWKTAPCGPSWEPSSRWRRRPRRTAR